MLDQSPAAMAAKQEIIDQLLSDVPTNTEIEVELPSECKVYNLEDETGPIMMRPMTFEDEKHIVTAKADQDPVNVILQRCVTNLKILDLLPIDKLYLIMKLREISYGDDYQCLLLCPNCKEENPAIVKLSELNVNPVPDDFTDPTEVFLPKLNKPAKIKLPRVRDEKLFLNTEKALDELWRFVYEIDGHTDKSILAAVVNKLPLVDIRTILNAMKTDFGVDTKIKLNCTSCKEVGVVDLPIDANFFDVN